MEKKIKELTKAEEEVMQILWMIKKGFVKDVLLHYKEPKPAYNTVSTIVRILEDKGFVGHKAFGKTHEYFPLVSKSDYSRFVLDHFTSGYFSGSFKNLLSFMAEEKKLSTRDMEEIEKIIRKHN